MGGGLGFGKTFGEEMKHYPPGLVISTGYHWLLIVQLLRWSCSKTILLPMDGIYNSSKIYKTENFEI